MSRLNLKSRCLRSLLHPQYFAISLRSTVATRLGGEPYCPMSGQDLLEVMPQSLIDPWALPLPLRLTSAFEVSLGRVSPRMNSKWGSVFRFE